MHKKIQNLFQKFLQNMRLLKNSLLYFQKITLRAELLYNLVCHNVTIYIRRPFTFSFFSSLRVNQCWQNLLCDLPKYLSKRIDSMTFDLRGQGGQNYKINLKFGMWDLLVILRILTLKLLTSEVKKRGKSMNNYFSQTSLIFLNL